MRVQWLLLVGLYELDIDNIIIAVVVIIANGDKDHNFTWNSAQAGSRMRAGVAKKGAYFIVKPEIMILKNKKQTKNRLL
jgi:hypothetical protein